MFVCCANKFVFVTAACSVNASREDRHPKFAIERPSLGYTQNWALVVFMVHIRGPVALERQTERATFSLSLRLSQLCDMEYECITKT